MSKMQHSVELGRADVAQLKWDYAIEEIDFMSALELTGVLDQRGEQGFELVQIYKGRALFKRLGVHDVHDVHAAERARQVKLIDDIMLRL